MKAVVSVYFPGGSRHRCEFDEMPLVGDRLLLNGSVFAVEERLWGLSDRHIALPALFVKEIEGENIGPSGRYDAVLRDLSG